ncbi:hypothetical protein ACFL2Q_08785 [Thermodesulfobacteriota bacterium]
MTQDEINQAEWENMDNWTSSTGLAVYFSKKDTRASVPKREPWQGSTLNLGHKSGVRWLYGLFGGAILFFNLIWIITILLIPGSR